jgi:hypothetical protein
MDLRQQLKKRGIDIPVSEVDNNVSNFRVISQCKKSMLTIKTAIDMEERPCHASLAASTGYCHANQKNLIPDFLVLEVICLATKIQRRCRQKDDGGRIIN